MGKLGKLAILLVLGLSLAAPQAGWAAPSSAQARDDRDEMDCTRKVKLSAATKKRLDQIYHRIYMDYLDMIHTYASAGALTESQKRTRMAMLKNYVQTFKWRNYQWCSEHERDEWEEEWFNAD